VNIRPEWVALSPTKEVIADAHGKILATVVQLSYERIWIFGKDSYLTKEQAKRAAERFLDNTNPRRGGLVVYSYFGDPSETP